MNRKVLVGCGVVLLILGAFAAVCLYTLPKLLNKGMAAVKDKVAAEVAIAAFENAWQAPSAKADAMWFPQEVGAWKRTGSAAIEGVPELRIERAGWSGVYESGARKFDVAVVPANDLEREALMKRATEALEGGSGMRTSSHMGNRMHVRIGADNQTLVWGLKDWLFIFRTRSTEDPMDFAKDWLDAIQKKN